VLLFSLDTLSIQTQASLLGLFITFVNNFHLNLVVFNVYVFNKSILSTKLYLNEVIHIIDVENTGRK